MTMTDTLALFAGALLSFAFSYIPGLSAKFDQLDATGKRVTMGAVLIVAAALLAGASCAPMLAGLLPEGWAVTCDQPGLLVFVRALVLALAANQSAYSITPQAKPAA